MCRIVIHEPEAIISLDLQILLKDEEVIKTTSLFNLLKTIRSKEIDILIIDINRIFGWQHLISFVCRHNIPVIILSSVQKRFLKVFRGPRCSIIELPFESSEILKTIEKYKSRLFKTERCKNGR